MSFRPLLLMIALLAVGARAHAETGYAASAAVTGSFNESWDWSAGGQVRLNGGKIDALMPEAAIGWQATDRLSFGSGYRFMRRRDGLGNFQDRSRAWISATVGWDLTERWQLRYRLRWQEESRDAADGSDRTYLRNRLLARYRLNGQWQPFGSIETHNRQNWSGSSGVSSYRYTLGATRDVGRRRELDIYIRHTDRTGAGASSKLIGVSFEYARE